MSQYKYAESGDTVYFWFAANETTGNAGDGASPLYDVRLGGAASDAAPAASGTPTLLSHADYSNGLYEIAVDTTGYSAGEYAVFCTLTISEVNPAGFCGSVKVRAAGAAALPTNLTHILGTAPTEGGAGRLAASFTKLLDVASPQLTSASKDQTGDSYAIVNGDHGLVSIQDDIGSLLADVGDASTSTLGSLYAILGNAAATIDSRTASGAPGANNGVPTTNGTKINQTVDLTAGQSIACSDKTGFALSATGADLILKGSTFVQAIVAALNEFATYGLTALNTLLVTTGIKTATTAAPTDMALNSTVAKDATVAKAADDFNATQKASITAAVPSVLSIQSGLSTLTAQQVWEYATRTLSAFGFSVTVGTNNDKTGYTLTVTPPTAADIKAAMETNGSKLDHLWEMTEDDGGTRRLTANALEEAPKDGAAPTVEQIRLEMEGVGNYLALIKTAAEAIDTLTKASGSGDLARALVILEKIYKSAATIVEGAAAAGTLSTTEMTTDLTEATDDHYNGRIVIWTSGVLANQATDITDYDGATKKLTYTAVTEAPTAADTFVIV